MLLSEWVDYDTTPYFLRDDNVPYSLPIVVRVEKNVNYSELDAFKAVSQLMAKVLEKNEWEENIKLWLKGCIRKVVRKARGVNWDNLYSLPHVSFQENNVEVLAFEPHLLDELNPLLKKLQVQGIDLTHSIPELSLTHGLNISLNPEVVMSTGKAMAQIGHAAQLAYMYSSPEVLNKWENSRVVNFVHWDCMPENSTFIEDAGFTEIVAGTLTAKSFIV